MRNERIDPNEFATAAGGPVHRSRGPGIGTMLLIGIGVVLLIWAISAIGRDDAEYARTASVSAGAIAEDPNAYYGKAVTVRAEVEKVFGPRMFTLDEDAVGAEPDVVVLTANPHGVGDDAEVTVHGTVRRFARGDLERDYDWIDDSLFAGRDLSDVDGRPVIVADSVSRG
jgi:hypothetical protein